MFYAVLPPVPLQLRKGTIIAIRQKAAVSPCLQPIIQRLLRYGREVGRVGRRWDEVG